MTSGQSFGDPAQAPSGDSVTRDATVNLNANVSDYSAQMAAATRDTNRLGTAVDSLSSKVDGLSKRAGRKLELFGGSVFAGLAGSIADAAALDKQLGTLRAGATITGASYKGLKNDVESAFTKFPIARGQAVALTGAVSNLGVTGVREIGALDRVFIKLGASTGESMTGLATDLIQLSRLMGTTNTTQIGNYANAVLTVSKNAGVSASGVLQFSQAIAPIARQAGIGEAAVIGISAAFSKAGADGFVAANVFNSIVNDITQLTKTGSPELAKYANFIGLTVSQFKKLPGKDQVTEIFAAVAKGGPKALAFANELGLGTRGLSALQAVAQSGGLQKQIAIATNSSHDQKNLNRSANAAFNDLGDSLTKVRNELTQMGDEIGGPLLTPIKAVTNGFDHLLHFTNEFIHALGPIAPLLGAMAGALSVVAGLALGHAALVGTFALGKTILGSGSRAAARAGVADARAGTGPAPGAPYGPGGPLRARLPYLAGGLYGRNTPTPDPNAEPGRLRQAGMFVARTPGRVATWAMNSQSTSLADSRKPGFQRSFYTNAAGESQSMRQRFTGLVEQNKAAMVSGGAMRTLAGDTVGLGRAMGRLTMETTKSAVGMAGSVARAGIGGLARGGAGFAGEAGGALRRGGAALGGAAFSLPGLLALSVGAPLIGALKGKINHADNQAFNVDGSLNAISKYDTLLGQTSTNLAQFNTAVSTASNKLDTLAGKSLSQVAQVTNPDIGTASSNYKVTDKNFASLQKTAPKNTRAAVAYIQSLAVQHGGMDAKTLQTIKTDLIATYGAPQAGKILQSYLKTNPANATGANVNYGAIGAIAKGSSGAKDLLGQGFSAAVAQAQFAPGSKSSRAELGAILKLGGPALTGKTLSSGDDNVKTFRALLAKTFGGKAGDYDQLIASDTTGDSAPDSRYKKAYGSGQATQRTILAAIASTKGGRQFLSSAGLKTDFNKPGQVSGNITQALGSLFPAPQDSATNSLLRSGGGSIGRFAASSRLVQAATGSSSGDPRLVQAATVALASKATAATGSFSGASEALMKLSDSMGGAATATGALLASAAAWARQLQSFQTPYQSRGQQLGASIKTLRTDQAAASAPGASQATVDQAKASRASYEQQKAGYQQYLISVLQQAQQYGIQMERAAEDENKQIYRSERNFQIQMLQSQQDFERSSLRSKQDFARQQVRQAEQSAQSIYNPFLRVQAQYTTDAGTLVQNLADQNQRIAQQYAQLAKLRKAGVSQAAIDALQLADPNNAQQLNNIVGSLAQNPQLVAQINKLVGARISATTKLTQSSFNMTFRNTVSDFNLSLNRASQDYNTAHDRAVQAQHIALTDMATDYNVMVSRSGADLKTSMTEIYGSFGSVFGRTMSLVTRDIGKYAPDAAAMIEKSLNDIKTKYPNLWDPHFTGASTAKPYSPGSSNSAEHNTPGGTPGQHGGSSGGGGFADGGISIGPQYAKVSEWSSTAAELHVPLNRGAQYTSGLAGQVARQVVLQMHTSPHPAMPRGEAGPMTVSYDYSTEYSGPITVKANDTKTLEKELAAKARLKRLTSPARH